MSDEILAVGPPPLTVDAADAALDAIDMIAAIVRGVDSIDVTNTVRPLWRQHLAAWYPHLPPVTRAWYANAPAMLARLRSQWPLLQPAQQAMVVQQWAVELPQMLWMLEPVLAQAQTIEARATVTSETQVTDAYARQQAIVDSLANHSTRMANVTTSLMNSMTNAIGASPNDLGATSGGGGSAIGGPAPPQPPPSRFNPER